MCVAMASSTAAVVPARSAQQSPRTLRRAPKLRDRRLVSRGYAGTKLDVFAGMRDVAASCLAEYASRGPRYTSYPPATEFAALAADRVQDELTGIGDRSEPFSLY